MVEQDSFLTSQTLYFARLIFALRLRCYRCCSSNCKSAHMQKDGFQCTYLKKHGEKSYQSNHSKQYAKERRPLPDNFLIRFCEDLKLSEMKHVIRSWQTPRITDHIKSEVTVWAAHHYDLGEDDCKHRLHGSVDHSTDCSYQNIRPLRNVETHHFKEWHRRNFLILQEDYWKLCYWLTEKVRQ